MDSGLIDSLRAAVEASPDDVRLRLHLAELLLEAGEPDEARVQLGRVLQLDPTSARAIELVAASQAGSRESKGLSGAIGTLFGFSAQDFAA